MAIEGPLMPRWKDILLHHAAWHVVLQFGEVKKKVVGGKKLGKARQKSTKKTFFSRQGTLRPY